MIRSSNCATRSLAIWVSRPLSSSWRGGFRDFYAAGFSETAMRVIPWSTIVTLGKFLQYERSRKIVRDEFGIQRAGVF